MTRINNRKLVKQAQRLALEVIVFVIMILSPCHGNAKNKHINAMNKENISKGTDTTAIKELIILAERNQINIDAFVPLHTEDVIIVNIAGRTIIGKDLFYQAMKQALDSPLANVFTTIEIKDIKFVNTDVAIVSCIKTILDKREQSTNVQNEKKLPKTGILTYTIVRKGSEWKIALAQTTPNL